MQLILPYPPTVNTYWRNLSGRTIISQRGREYRDLLQVLLMGKRMERGRLFVIIDVCPPDMRRRDLDNLTKSLLDGLTHAGVIEDDHLIDDLRIIRRPVVKGGLVVVNLEVIASEFLILNQLWKPPHDSHGCEHSRHA